MAKIFIDVGGYHGMSTMAALDPRFGFTAVHCFEPVRSCYDHIVRTVTSPLLRVYNAGLLDRTAKLPIYQAGSLGGSVYSDAPHSGGGTQTCEFLDASEFFRRAIRPNDRVWMKLNCEGAECDIMLNLIESGEATKLTEVLLDLDAKKITSAQEKLAKLEALLPSAPFSYHYPEEVQYEMINNYGGIRNWLTVTGAAEEDVISILKSIVYQLRYVLNPEINGYYKIKVLRKLRLRPPPSVPTKPGSAVGRSRQYQSAL